MYLYLCLNVATNFCYIKVVQGAKPCGRRKRRALNDNSITLPAIGDEDTYIYDPPPFNISMPSFPTLKGKTERNARNACISSIENSAVGKACLKTIENFDIQPYIDHCITDVRVSIIFINENILKVRKRICVHIQMWEVAGSLEPQYVLVLQI